MLKSSLLMALLAVCLSVSAQSVPSTPSPESFLGYTPGQRFTPHHRVAAYAQAVAQARPDQVKLIPYGQTYEGRPLMAIVVASPQNLARLENIRTDNLKRTGLLAGTPSTGAQPAIAWLSYNVHGNEAVSSEAFMEVLYGLLNPATTNGQATAKLLDDMVVILDPCLNPDGHDRYVNWYNQMMGRNANASSIAREHAEPWPGGRYSHYYFDPNRDWAWQTQEVTQQRMALYQQWMPQLHADFHEMGAENPYYFAPSAKPYHEDITPYQRRFQERIGEYSAKAFDKNGWLYYSHERYDLFYPSYGDTWPTYNGAIGMTFEQGGGGRAGVAFEKANGDTLTLRQRIDHHVATSFATLNSIVDRPAEVVREFGQFFERAQTNPVGPYKTYVVKPNGDPARLMALRQLLDRNQIRYGQAAGTQTLPGFSYATGQTEKAVSVATGDLVISAFQPKSTLLKILFEPKSALEDSVTYDITAWSLPYAYGLPTYGLTTRLTPGPIDAPATTPVDNMTTVSTGQRPYAYLARWQSLPGAQLLAALYKQKIKVRASEKSFTLDGTTYPAGTLLITRAGNDRLADRFDAVVRQTAAQVGISLTPVMTGHVTNGSDFGSDFVMALKQPRVGSLMGEGLTPTACGGIWYFFDRDLNYPITLVDPNTLSASVLNRLDVLILPGGSGYGRILAEKNLALVRDWVRAGGRLIALEQAAAFLAGKEGFNLKERADTDKTDMAKGTKTATDSLRRYADRERTAVSDETPGSIYRVSLDPTHPLAFGLGDGYYSLVLNTNNFDLLKDDWNVGYLKKNSYIAGFVGKNARAKLQNTLVLGVQDIGRGDVVYMADDPLFRGFWYSGKLLFANAVFMN